MARTFTPAPQVPPLTYTDQWLDTGYTTSPGQYDEAISRAAGALLAPPAAAGAGAGAGAGATALAGNPYVAMAMAAMSVGAGIHDIVQSKKQLRKERQRIKAQFAAERRRARLDVVDGGEGVARRMGSDVAAQMSAAGMGGSGAAMGAVMNNRMQVLANIPGQLSSAMTSINAQEEQARQQAQADADAAWNSGMAGIAKAIPILGKIQVRR